jgi:hypothetical protein
MFLRALREQSGGAGGSGSGAGAPPAGSPPANPPADPPAQNPPASGGQPPVPPGYVPAESLRAVTAERDRLKKAHDDAEAAKLTANGEHEKLAAQEKTKREEAEARAERVARRAAFLAGSSGKVADSEAAYKLAVADGLVGFKVDEEGIPEDPKAVEAAVAEVTKRYPFLKGKGTPTNDFGNDHGGTQPGAPVDVEKMTPVEKMVYGMTQNPVAGRGASR